VGIRESRFDVGEQPDYEKSPDGGRHDPSAAAQVVADNRAEEARDRLSEDELVAMTFLLLVAGHETTVNLIGNGVLAPLKHPDQMERLRAEPARLDTAVEELLRYAGPVETATERSTREDVTLAGVTIPRGSLVFAVLASANRDERQFPDPDRLDVAREPNRHLSFGLGPHFCLGAPLAQVEAQVAIDLATKHREKLATLLTHNCQTWNDVSRLNA
jgi:cytochrome P450